MRPSGLAKVIFDLQWISYIYFLVTLLTCVQAMFKSSFTVGAMALAASALSYFGTAGFAGSFRARRDKNYNPKDLAGIGAIAVVLSVAGIALMAWSGFWLSLFGVFIAGPMWCLVGILVASLTTKREHAL
jgi:hypothetical protein